MLARLRYIFCPQSEQNTKLKNILYPILFTAHGKSYFTVEAELFESDKEFLCGDALNIERRSAKLIELYEDISEAFIPIKCRTAESIADFVVRYERLQTLERETSARQSKVDNEKQPNKRIEQNLNIKAIKKRNGGFKIMAKQKDNLPSAVKGDNITVTGAEHELFDSIREVLNTARNKAYAAVNFSMVEATSLSARSPSNHQKDTANPQMCPSIYLTRIRELLYTLFSQFRTPRKRS